MSNPKVLSPSFGGTDNLPTMDEIKAAMPGSGDNTPENIRETDPQPPGTPVRMSVNANGLLNQVTVEIGTGGFMPLTELIVNHVNLVESFGVLQEAYEELSLAYNNLEKAHREAVDEILEARNTAVQLYPTLKPEWTLSQQIMKIGTGGVKRG